MAYLGRTPSQAVRSRYYFTASGGETSLSGTDDNGNTLSFNDGNYVDVYLNGALLVADTDYNTTTANTISSLAALTASDVAEIVVYDTFSVFSGNVNSDFSVGGNLTITGATTTSGNITFGDNNKAIFGASSDLQIYHDGFHSYIKDAGTGQLRILATDLRINNTANDKSYITGTDGAEITLYHNGSGKLATTSSGIDVTGSVTLGDGHQIGDETTYDNLVIKSSTDENMVLSAGGTGQFIYKTGSTTLDNGSEKMRLTNDGKLGLGTTAPNKVLHLETSGETVQRMVASTTNLAGFYFGDSGNGSIGQLIYDNSSDAMRFNTNGAERMRLDSSGRLAIGTTVHQGTLHVKNTDDNATLPSVADSFVLSHQSGTYTAGNYYNVLGFAKANSNGGTLGASIAPVMDASGYTSALTFGVASGSSQIAERMRIDGSGNLLVGTTSAGSAHGIKTVYSSGTVDTNVSEITSTSGTGFHWTFRRGASEVGTITSTSSSTSYNTSSDYRLKENVTEVTGAADRVKALNPVRFNFIADPDTTVDGFLAHEVADVVPEAISGAKDAVDDEGNAVYQGIDQSKLVPLLTAALQEALTKIDDLESRLSALENV